MSAWIWPVARMHTAIRQASRLVETARREPLGMSFTLLTISMPCPGLSGEPRQQVGERLRWRLPCPGGTMPRRDHRGLQQAQVIAREIEDLGDGRDVGRAPQIDAGQPQHRLVDHAEIGFDRRLGLPIRAPRTARSTETLRTRAPSGKSMPRKKMSLQPLCVRSMRTGRGFAQDRERHGGAARSSSGRRRSG